MNSCNGDMQRVVLGLRGNLRSPQQLSLQVMRLVGYPQQCDLSKELQAQSRQGGIAIGSLVNHHAGTKKVKPGAPG